MREIKFRVWDNINKNMRYDIAEIDFEKNRISFKNPKNRTVSENYREFWDLPYELKQYTGLKDVNGREIYGEDILEVNHPTNKDFSGVFTVEISPETMNFVVGAFNLGSGVYKYSKVIGNTYENPELLSK